MQSYELKLDGPGDVKALYVDANFISYESGRNAIENASAKIRVRHSSGEVYLKPGQSIRLPDKNREWAVSALDGVSVITGVIVLGFGEFSDANTENTVVLSGEFANNVTVNNAASQPVPVSFAGGELEVKNDAGNPLSVKIQGTVQTVGSYLVFRKSATIGNVLIQAGIPLKLVDFGETNIGFEIHRLMMVANGSVMTVVAKKTPPAHPFDGDVLALASGSVGDLVVYNGETLRVDREKSVWVCSVGDGTGTVSALYTNL